MIGPWKRIAEQAEEIREARAEIRRLTDAIIAMKPAGFSADPPSRVDIDEDPVDELDNQVRDAIRQMAEDQAEADEFEAYARGEIDGGKTASDVAHEILRGLDPFVYLSE